MSSAAEERAELARAVAAEVVRLLGGAAEVVGPGPKRLSARAAARLMGCDPKTFKRRWVATGFLAAGRDGRFSRRDVLRVRGEG